MYSTYRGRKGGDEKGVVPVGAKEKYSCKRGKQPSPFFRRDANPGERNRRHRGLEVYTFQFKRGGKNHHGVCGKKKEKKH